MAETYIDLPVLDSAFVNSAYPDTNIDGQSEYTFTGNSSAERQRIFLHIQEPSNEIRGKRLYRVAVVGKYKNYSGALQLAGCTQSFFPQFVTWNTQPSIVNVGPDIMCYGYKESLTDFVVPNWSRTTSYTASEISEKSSWALRGYGIALHGEASVRNSGLTISMTGLALRVYYDDTENALAKVTILSAPTSGYVNPRTATPFSWHFEPAGTYMSVKPWTQQDARLLWRKVGDSTWSAISSGMANSLTVPANTFPSGQTIEWRVQATDNLGTITTTPDYTFSTAAGAVTATPTSPVDSVEANDSEITFRWNVTSADGQAQSGSELQYSTNGSSWSALGTVSGSGTSYVCPANTLPSGTLYWRVRASNIDGTAGAWSSAVSFVSFGAPAAPSVTVTARNFATISWQATEQEAYRIKVDGKTIGTFFGTEKTYQLTDPLRTGTHTVSVEVQNSFGLWSQPGTASAAVTEISVSVTHIVSIRGNVDAEITYNIDPDSFGYSAIYLHRDGVKIASLPVVLGNGQTYVDRFALGKHSYQIVVRTQNGNGIFTPIVSADIKLCGAPRISPLSGGEWMKLRLSETTRRTEAFTKQRQVSIRHFSGAEYPLAEVSPYTDASGSYDCAFENVDDANAFEALYGQVVILKTKAENVVIGVLSGYEKQVNRHYIAYTFTIQRIYWRDYLDLTND